MFLRVFFALTDRDLTIVARNILRGDKEIRTKKVDCSQHGDNLLILL